MTTRTTTKAGHITRRMIIAMVAMGIIALALGYFAHPVYAADQVDNHQLDGGKTLSSLGFNEDDKVCDAGGFTSGVTWHFVLNQYESGDAQLFGSFADAGSFGPIDSSKRAGPVLMFYVNTPTDDTLVTNWAILDTADEDAQLQLSSVCHAPEEEQSVSETESASEAESVPASASGEQSVEAGTGTPAESTPNGALSLNGVGALPTIAFSLVLLASLGALAYANVKSVRS